MGVHVYLTVYLPDSLTKIPVIMNRDCSICNNLVFNLWMSCFLNLWMSCFFRKNLVGTVFNVRKACGELGNNWVHGIRQCEIFFSGS